MDKEISNIEAGIIILEILDKAKQVLNKHGIPTENNKKLECIVEEGDIYLKAIEE
jgi:hypothetical protein